MQGKPVQKIEVINYSAMRRALMALDQDKAQATLKQNDSQSVVKMSEDKEYDDKPERKQLSQIRGLVSSIWMDELHDFTKSVFGVELGCPSLTGVEVYKTRSRDYWITSFFLAEYETHNALVSPYFRGATAILSILYEAKKGSSYQMAPYEVANRRFRMARDHNVPTILVCVNKNNKSENLRAAKEYQDMQNEKLIDHEIDIFLDDKNFNQSFFQQLDEILSIECHDLLTAQTLEEKPSSEDIVDDRNGRCVIF